MTRYTKDFKGTMAPAAGPRAVSAVKPTGPAPVRPRVLATPAVKPRVLATPAGKQTVTGTPKSQPSGPMVPVRGGGMAPASAATTMKKGGSVSSASKRADGCAIRGKTRA